MSSSQSQTKTKGKKEPVSDYEFLKAWGGWHQFMLSYSLKPWDDDDVQEAKEIIRRLKANQEEE
ncbi:hypothetical protein GLOTRDRAFT_42001 [Gloeophyllum trabeum ATCC 11539]|uniref:Uncharacterized protein n=1 Tax=Gloeophyllum trabeum (strain ATCC 11539 / FP-39264 / Madison 617) TaxID=670483 RepID=S7Q6F2_GLOTA|nr:uncharacterized protein GLOTRDRAFT_42001 [Gloeophyllum trabeum ATCC 11539]EPQ55087.1 hypothetical protein GLOTRDRAFT_42001 [Gloeophyllum trabeum ATCC 11539]